MLIPFHRRATDVPGRPKALLRQALDSETDLHVACSIGQLGLDLAKRIFRLHAVGASGDVVVRKALRRSQVLPFFTKLPPCLIGMEACGTSHHWARALTELGHEVRLMPPAYVSPM